MLTEQFEHRAAKWVQGMEQERMLRQDVSPVWSLPTGNLGGRGNRCIMHGTVQLDR